MSVKKTTEEFIEKATDLYGDKYCYKESVYKNAKEKVKIKCKKHNHVFYQLPYGHLTKKEGCTFCVQEKRTKDTETFIKEAIQTHGELYDYSFVIYKSYRDKIDILCKKHNKIFKQRPTKHIEGRGCPLCGNEKKGIISTERKINLVSTFITKSKEIFGDNYTYENVDYVNNKNHIVLECKKHKVQFTTTPDNHFNTKSGGCPVCATDYYRQAKLDTTEQFIQKSKNLFGDTYSYKNCEYTGVNNSVILGCPIHGNFEVSANNHLHAGVGCKKCSSRLSKVEKVLMDYISDYGVISLQSDRQLIKPLELDIVIPEKKIAIEYNGVYWHSEKFGKDKHYHKSKSDLCKEKGYRLIHIWEDDFIKNPERELNFIKYSLGLYDEEKVYARKTTIKEIPNKLGREFLDKHHIQGSGVGSVYFGLYYQEELVAVTSFLKKNGYLELTRHCTDRQVLGGLGKITKFASKRFKQDILSFCDLSRFDGKSYLSCGYEIDKEIPPDYKYVVGEERQHKFIWRKKSIKDKLPHIYDEGLTEKEMMEKAEIPRIWDCGKLRLIYKYK